MRSYFSQFGDIKRLRLSRNRKTGRPKHYAFIEFSSTQVAKIVAETMNNYLLFGHILKCAFVPKEQVHENLWKGANKRFKAVPWAKLEGRKLELGMGREGWDKRIGREEERRKVKGEKLLEVLGYDAVGEVDRGIKKTESVPVKIGRAIAEAVGLGSVVGGGGGGGGSGSASGGEITEEQSKTLVVDEGGEGSSLIVSEEVKTTKKGKKGEIVEREIKTKTEKKKEREKPKKGKTAATTTT